MMGGSAFTSASTSAPALSVRLRELCLKIIIEDIQWFTFQSIVLHRENHSNSSTDHLQSLFKLFSMFKISIWYDNSIVCKDVPDAVGIMCINYGKTICCEIYKRQIKYCITPFVTNMLFRNCSLYFIIQFNQNLNFYFW